jgi:hypothetical protein
MVIFVVVFGHVFDTSDIGDLAGWPAVENVIGLRIRKTDFENGQAFIDGSCPSPRTTAKSSGLFQDFAGPESPRHQSDGCGSKGTCRPQKFADPEPLRDAGDGCGTKRTRRFQDFADLEPL